MMNYIYIYIQDLCGIESNMLCAYSVIVFDVALVFVVKFGMVRM
jgi:hypothetical protein